MSTPAPTYKYTILAVGIGNALEWYDFAIFGALADIFGEHFFPIQSRGTQLMAAFSVYCSAFFMRPAGGFMFGYIGDTQGRKKALELSIGLMILTSFAIGVLPTYEMIGYVATVMIVLLRMLQGVAVGGEMVGAYIYTVEGCPDQWVAFWSGVCKATGLFGTVLGMGFVALLREFLSEQQFYSWGWRIPFLTSIAMGVLGGYLRSFLKESKEFAQNQITSVPTTVTIWGAVHFHWPEIISVAVIVSFWATGFYTSFIWMAYYTSELMMMARAETAGTGTEGGDEEKTGVVPHAWLINTVMMGVFVVLIPCAGLVADAAVYQHHASTGVGASVSHQRRDVGYRRSMVCGALAVVLSAGPVFYLVNMRTVWSACAGYLLLSLGLALYGSCLPVVMVKQFTVQHRYTGMGIAYNVANAIFAGIAPLIQTTMVLHVRTRSPLVNSTVIPAALLMSVGLLSISSLIWGVDACQYIRRVFVMKKWNGVEDGAACTRDTGIDLTTGRSRSSSNGSSVMDSSVMDGSVSSVSSERSIDTSSSPMIK